MKKVLIGMAAGAMALGASVVPASAGYGTDNLWDGIAGTKSEDSDNTSGDAFCNDDQADIFEALVLTGGWASRLDTDGNGKPRYTVFQPYDAILDLVLGAFELEISDLNDQPATVQAILADHIANGSFDENELEDKDLTSITMRSGYVATISTAGGNLASVASGGSGIRDIYDNVYIAGALIEEGNQYDNGWLYCIAGWINSEAQVAHEGLNSQDTPQDGTPGGTNTLPDTL
jgi:hypothetical protein